MLKKIDDFLLHLDRYVHAHASELVTEFVIWHYKNVRRQMQCIDSMSCIWLHRQGAQLTSSWCQLFGMCQSYWLKHINHQHLSNHSHVVPVQVKRGCTPTVPYNLPRLFMATNKSLLTPYRLTTPLSTVEISMRPESINHFREHDGWPEGVAAGFFFPLTRIMLRISHALCSISALLGVTLRSDDSLFCILHIRSHSIIYLFVLARVRVGIAPFAWSWAPPPPARWSWPTA